MPLYCLFAAVPLSYNANASLICCAFGQSARSSWVPFWCISDQILIYAICKSMKIMTSFPVRKEIHVALFLGVTKCLPSTSSWHSHEAHCNIPVLHVNRTKAAGRACEQTIPALRNCHGCSWTLMKKLVRLGCISFWQLPSSVVMRVTKCLPSTSAYLFMNSRTID